MKEHQSNVQENYTSIAKRSKYYEPWSKTKHRLFSKNQQKKYKIKDGKTTRQNTRIKMKLKAYMQPPVEVTTKQNNKLDILDVMDLQILNI